MDTHGSPRVLDRLDRSLADRIVAVYLLAAGLWIVVTGPVADQIADRTGTPVVWIEVSKGLAFVLVTAVILRVSLARWVKRIEAAALAERDAADRMRRAEQERLGFFNAISHELRTPLTSVVGYSQIIQRLAHEQPDTARADLADITERLTANAKRLELLVVDLLEVGRPHPVLEDVRLRRAEVRELLEQVIAAADVGDRDVMVSGDAVEVEADTEKLERAVQLVLDNVCRHTPPSTTITAGVRSDGDEVVITIEDDGPGLPEDRLEEVFAPFVQGTAAIRSASPGMGVGLTLVERYLRLHGGGAVASNRSEGGARFELRLPQRQSSALRPSAPHALD
ncbi:MAG: sensor histidine kinase [Nitriliruptoraceae bacterium]